ncbi:MAG: glycosyltransferase [Micavibrio aeruginosavorus]|uniref:Glycosyltransferase n=1 Tax=Micavibrio aeruginosavorus TaxID=349221 RepID=A0A7T5R3J7_9BACT|nr:MAG: glycosyltransferase [Micavibrio aeruginosavorus]
MTDPVFSVITVSRNHLSGLKATASALSHENQTLFEWIVIDGASDDGTQDYLQTTNARWISESDHGIYDAMNKGLERAAGEYVLFLNAGDTLALPRTLDTLAEYLKARPVNPDLIYGDAFEDTGSGRVIKPAHSHKTLHQGLFTHHQAILYRRALIDGLLYDRAYSIAADYKFTAQFIMRCQDIMYWPRPLCLFEPGGLSQRQAFKGRMQQSLIRRELHMTLPMEEIFILLRQTLTLALRRYCPALYWRLRATSA